MEKKISTLEFIKGEMGRRGIKTLHSNTSTSARRYTNLIPWENFVNPYEFRWYPVVVEILNTLGIYEGPGQWNIDAIYFDFKNGSGCDATSLEEIENWHAFVQEMLDTIDWNSEEFYYFTDEE